MAQKIERKYHLFDAQGETLGRLATEISKVLHGKQKVTWTPNVDAGDFVVVINTDKVRVTGNKMEGKIYHHFSGYPGGVASIKLKDQLKKDSRKVIEMAVSGMLRKNTFRNKMLRRLLIYKNSEHKHKIDITH